MFRIKLACLSYLILLWHVALAQNITEDFKLLCSQVMDAQLLERCCGDTKLSQLPFQESNCSSLKDVHGACRYECYFKHWRLLDENNQLDRDNVNRMIEQLYLRNTDQYSYGQHLLAAFVHCSKPSAFNVHKLPFEVLHMMSAHKYSPIGPMDCQANAMKYAKCALAHTYLHCPKEYRPIEDEETGDCGASRRLTNHCVSLATSNIAGNDQSFKTLKRLMRSAAVSYKLKRRWQPTTHWYTAFVNWFVF